VLLKKEREREREREGGRERERYDYRVWILHKMILSLPNI